MKYFSFFFTLSRETIILEKIQLYWRNYSNKYVCAPVKKNYVITDNTHFYDICPNYQIILEIIQIYWRKYSNKYMCPCQEKWRHYRSHPFLWHLPILSNYTRNNPIILEKIQQQVRARPCQENWRHCRSHQFLWHLSKLSNYTGNNPITYWRKYSNKYVPLSSKMTLLQITPIFFTFVAKRGLIDTCITCSTRC